MKKITSIILSLLVVLTLALTPSVFAADKGTSTGFYTYSGSANGGAGLYLAYQGSTINLPATLVTSSDNLTKDIASYNSAATSATWQFYRGSDTTPSYSTTGKVLNISYSTWQYISNASSTTVAVKVTSIQYDYTTGMSISSGSYTGISVSGNLFVKYNNNTSIPLSIVDRPFNINISAYAQNAISATWKVYDVGVGSAPWTTPIRTITGATLSSGGRWGTTITGPVVITVSNIQYADEERPAISGQETFVTSVSNPQTVAYFQSYLSAYDNLDGNVTAGIYVITDGYTANKNTLGTYQVTFGVSDAAGNLATLVVNITVADITPPVITGNTTTATIGYAETWNITSFKSSLAVSDNYYTLSPSNITVKSDGYTANKTNLGTYQVVYAITDGSGNEGTFTKNIQVVDNVAPTWTGPTTIQKPATSILTVNDVKALLTATDYKEGTKTANIIVQTDNYTGHGNELGTYTIVFRVQDSANNASTHTVTITVYDDIAPIWFIQDGVSIALVEPASITRQQIIDLLIATGQLEVGATTNYYFYLDEYTGNEDVPGIYLVGINVADTAGNEQQFNLAITVLDGEEPDGTLNPGSSFNLGAWITDHPWESLGIGAGTLLLLLVSGLLLFGKKPKYRKKR